MNSQKSVGKLCGGYLSIYEEVDSVVMRIDNIKYFYLKVTKQLNNAWSRMAPVGMVLSWFTWVILTSAEICLKECQLIWMYAFSVNSQNAVTKS